MGSHKGKEAREPLMTAGQAAAYLRISKVTLWKAEKGGGLIPYRTPGGHRRYTVRMLNKYLQSTRRQK